MYFSGQFLVMGDMSLDNRTPLDLVLPVDFAARGESHHAGTADRQSVSVGV